VSSLRGTKKITKKRKRKMAETTFEQVKAIIVEKLGVNADEVKETSSFVNDLGADSLDVVEFVMEVEKKFDIQIPDDDAGKLDTVDKAVAYIEAHKK
jgi:acyl carrier protein